MVRFKGGVERRSRGQKRKMERIRDGAGEEEIKRAKANGLKANIPGNYFQFEKKNCLALGGCKLDKNLFFRAFIILVLNIVWYDSVVCLIHQMESILIAICPIILWKQCHHQIWTAAFPNTCSAAKRAPVPLPPARSQAWQTARFYVIPGVGFQLG